MLFFAYWIGAFLFSDFLIYLLYKRSEGNIQFFTCLGISAFPLTLFPYAYLLVPCDAAGLILPPLQVWSLLLLSSAVSFAKGLRLDKAFLVGLTVLYLNVTLLIVTGRLA